MHYFTVEKDQSSSHITDSDDYNESIIIAVQSRPGLYDHRIPVKERTHLKKQSLWNEVLNTVGGTFKSFYYKQTFLLNKV